MCGHGSTAERVLPKDRIRVQFPLPALNRSEKQKMLYADVAQW